MLLVAVFSTLLLLPACRFLVVSARNMVKYQTGCLSTQTPFASLWWYQHPTKNVAQLEEPLIRRTEILSKTVI